MTKGWLVIALVALSALVSGCDRQPKGPGGEIWKEEVRLMNGDLIIVDRRNVYGGSGDLSQSHGPLTDSELRFDYKGKHYEWVQHGLGPLALQEDQEGRMYIVSGLWYCWAWAKWGKPDSFYVVHRFQDGKWNRVTIEEVDQSTVFNLAGGSNDPRVKEPRDYSPETAVKFGNNKHIPADYRHIVPGKRVRACQ